MSLMAFAAPILPGKRAQWEAFIAEIAGPKREEFNASRQRLGVRERTFLQETPLGDFVIVTLEGDTPLEAFGAIAHTDDDFTRWFVQQVQEVHGFDLRQPPDNENPPRLLIDSAVAAGQEGPGVQDSVAVLRRVIDEVINNKNLALFDDLFAPDFVEHELPPGVPQGREGTRQLFAMLHSAFPDMHVEIEDVVAQGDKVVFRMFWRGTHTGAFVDIPPTGRQVTFEVFDLVRVADGKIAEHWGLMDQLSLMQQIGVIPAPEEATV